MTTFTQRQRIGSGAHRLAENILTWGRMIKFSHTLYALPFALSAGVLAHRRLPLKVTELLLVLAALVCARSAAMGFNRIVDAPLDAANARTAERAIPTGRLSLRAAGLFTVVTGAGFILAAAGLGRVPLLLSGPVLAILLLYSYAKRLSWLTHLYLGLAIALAPLGTWIALAKGFEPSVLWLSLALMAHIAAFDILYALQDEAVDRRLGLHSIPARFGARRARQLARGLHLLALLALLATGVAFDLGLVYVSAVALIAVLMATEHWLARGADLQRLGMAFFHANAAISVLIFLGMLGDELARHLT
jgi:4-hydroxybenzoate polyprenyltransferase